MAQAEEQSSGRSDWAAYLFLALPASGAAAISFLLGLLYAATMFSPAFIFGIGGFWDAPAGIMAGSIADMETTFSGYMYFVRDEWRFPLLHVPQLGTPEGSNAGMTDVVPWVALLGKAIFHVLGLYINPYGIWTALMFVGNGMAMTFLLRAVEQRSLLATIAGTGFGLMMPALHYRFGHLALSAHCLVVSSLAGYFYRSRGAGFKSELAEWSIYFLALLTNIYLAAMCGAIFTASTVRAITARELTVFSAALRMAMLIAGSLAVLLALGMIGNGVTFAAFGFGHFSMNLTSLFWPDHFGVLGQQEGYAFIGLGTLALLLAALTKIDSNLSATARRHWPLVAVLVLCAVFAASNEIYFGPWKVLHIPLPDVLISGVFGIFRSSGRFIWPLMYFLPFAAVATVLRNHTPRNAAVFIGMALALQFLSVSPWHGAVAEAAAHRPPQADKNLADLLAASERVEIYPSFQCAGRSSPLASLQRRVSLQMLTAPALKPINSVYLARSQRDCEAEVPPRELVPGTLYFFFDDEAAESLKRYPAQACKAGPEETICAVPAPQGSVAER